jgi:hypothetical protein
MNRLQKSRSLWLLGIFLAGIILVTFFNRWGWSDQFCLNNGDVRTCIFGVPISCREIPEIQRNTITAAASRAGIPHLWVTSRWANSYSTLYQDASTWEAVDPKILPLILDDISSPIKRGLSPAYVECRDIVPFGMAAIDENGVEIDWKTNAEVRRFCTRHGYMP